MRDYELTRRDDRSIVVEIEIGVLRSQCLDRRIASHEHLISEIGASERQRDAFRSPHQVDVHNR
jgi:hypothetical protein